MRQYSPMPASMFLPVLGASFNLNNMPLELSKGQAKSLLHSFMNSQMRSQHRRESQGVPPEGKGRSYSDSWGYNRLPPPPVPADRKYTTSVATYSETAREAQENQGSQPKPFRRPIAFDSRDYSRENGAPPPPPPPPMYYHSSPNYYGASSEDIPHSIHGYGSQEGVRGGSSVQAGQTWGADILNKPSKGSQTETDHEKMELDRKIAALNNEILLNTKNLDRMKEAVCGLEEENKKLKDILKEKENVVQQQLLELDDVRAEFFSSYDEENIRQGQPSGQQPASCSDMVSPPQSTHGFQTPVHAAPMPVPAQGFSKVENVKNVVPNGQGQPPYPREAQRTAPSGPGIPQPPFDHTPHQQIFPDQNVVTQQILQPRTINASPSQQVGYFYVPDTSPPVEEQRSMHQGWNSRVDRVSQYQDVQPDRQGVINQDRVHGGAGRVSDPEVARAPQQHADLPQPPVNAVAQQLPTPRQSRSTNNLGPLGGGFSSPRSQSPSRNQMGFGYQSHVSRGGQDAWGH